ncbi:MAG: SLC13 family permease [Anaerolineales bacterium]|jgi:di/tricarboxylate transporter
MTIENILVLGILLGAVILFVTERLRVDVVALMVLVSLILTGLITPEEAFSGFSSPAVITVWAVFIVSGAIVRTGVADRLAQMLMRVAGNSQARMTAVIMLTVGVMSAFMNNIGAVAMLLPAVVTMARKAGIAPSKLLIPLSFASLLGGNMTLIGTPPNILASSILDDYGAVPPFRFFDFLPTGLLVLTAGVVYMVLIGRRLLPERTAGGEVSQAYPLQDYLAEVRVGDNSLLIGKTIQESAIGESYDLNVVHVYSGNGEPLFSTSDHRLKADDILLVEGSPTDVLEASKEQGLVPKPEWRFEQLEQEAATGVVDLVEVSLAPRGSLHGKTLKQVRFRERFGLNVLAIRHQGAAMLSRLGDIPLHFGDVLLVEGAPDKVDLLRREADFLMLDTPKFELRRTRKAPLAIGILAGVLVFVTAGVLPVSAGMLVGALLLILTNTIRMEEAYQSIEWKSVFLIAGMLPLGVAMENTGTALLLAEQITAVMGRWGPLAVLMGIFLLTALVTEVISNAAATVLMVPIAIDAARTIGVLPQPFVMAVVLAASTSFLMPIGHQVNVLVFGPGAYKFLDYTKVGVWLNVIILALVMIAVPLIWPFSH